MGLKEIEEAAHAVRNARRVYDARHQTQQEAYRQMEWAREELNRTVAAYDKLCQKYVERS